MSGARYEKILASVLDDPTMTDAELRLAMYLARRPPGWVVIPAVVAKEIKRNERHWVRPTLRLLAARGILVAGRERGERAQFGAVTYRICREELVAPDSKENPRSGPATGKPSMVPPAETIEDQAFPQVGPQAQSPSTAPPAETQNPRSDHGRSDRARSNDRRKRTDKEPRTDKEQTPTSPLRGEVPPKPNRGTRIPDDFREQLFADKAAGAWFREHCPGVNVREETDNFVDYWTQRSGAIASKRDWIAAWRNWMRDEQKKTDRYKTRPAGRLEKAAEVARKNRVGGQPSAAMTAFARAAGMDVTNPTEESRREITS
jgi:hypothetical protein